MSLGTLYTIEIQAKGRIVCFIFSIGPISLTSIQIRAVAELGGLQYDLPKDYVHHTTNLTPEYLAKFPSGKIPAWEGKDGFKLFESYPIARYRKSGSVSASNLDFSYDETLKSFSYPCLNNSCRDL